MGIRSKRRQNLTKILEEYSVRQVQYYEKYDKMPLHSFSDRYREKMKIFETLPEPAQKTKPTFIYRFAMIFICAIVALLIVNQASAYVFGRTLWDKLTQPEPEEMVSTVYQEKEGGRNEKRGEGTTGKERVHDIPTEIPEGYELVSETNNEKGIFVKWKSDDSKELVFIAFGISQDAHMYENGDWETKDSIKVMGYKGTIYSKANHIYLFWDDEKYHNNLTSDNISKEQLLMIAESLY